MRHSQRNFALLLLAAFLGLLVAGCSNKGIHMPKHRKRRHCNCPTFSMATPAQMPESVAYYMTSTTL